MLRKDDGSQISVETKSLRYKKKIDDLRPVPSTGAPMAMLPQQPEVVVPEQFGNRVMLALTPTRKDCETFGPSPLFPEPDGLFQCPKNMFRRTLEAYEVDKGVEIVVSYGSCQFSEFENACGEQLFWHIDLSDHDRSLGEVDLVLVQCSPSAQMGIYQFEPIAEGYDTSTPDSVWIVFKSLVKNGPFYPSFSPG